MHRLPLYHLIYALLVIDHGSGDLIKTKVSQSVVVIPCMAVISTASLTACSGRYRIW